MHVVGHEDPWEFSARTRSFLLEDEARHNLLLGIATTLIERPEAYPEFDLWTVERNGMVVAVATKTPPFNLAVSRSGTDGAISALARAIHEEGVGIPGVTGAIPEADEFARAWAALSGTTPRLAMAQRIYQLTSVKPVRGVIGRMREATTSDRDLLVRWTIEFGAEALPKDEPMEAERLVDLRLRGRGVGLVLWEDDEPVSFAGYGGPTPNGIRIGPVYTPPALRRNGYAGALVAGLSRRLLDEGRTFCGNYKVSARILRP